MKHNALLDGLKVITPKMEITCSTYKEAYELYTVLRAKSEKEARLCN